MGASVNPLWLLLIIPGSMALALVGLWLWFIIKAFMGSWDL